MASLLPEEEVIGLAGDATVAAGPSRAQDAVQRLRGSVHEGSEGGVSGGREGFCGGFSARSRTTHEASALHPPAVLLWAFGPQACFGTSMGLLRFCAACVCW